MFPFSFIATFTVSSLPGYPQACYNFYNLNISTVKVPYMLNQVMLKVTINKDGNRAGNHSAFISNY